MEESKSNGQFIRWRPHDKGDSIAWGLILIWGALIILGGSLDFADQYSWWNPWGLIFIGMGIIGLAGSLLRFLIPAVPNASLWDFLFGLFFYSLALAIKQGGSGQWPFLSSGFRSFEAPIERIIHEHQKVNHGFRNHRIPGFTEAFEQDACRISIH